MTMQINDIESDLDISILKPEDGNTTDITINYSSDASSIGTIIYVIISIIIVIKSILHGGKTQHSTYYIEYFIIIVIL